MFGFLAPLDKNPIWRQSYARVCQFQNRLFGISSLPFLSYEATFLYQLAIDSGIASQLPGDAPTCCRLKKIPKASLLSSQPHGMSEVSANALPPTICAAFGVMLAGVKLQDDVTDSGRWSARLLWWIYRRRVHRAEEMLESRMPGLLAAIRECLLQHQAIEQSSTPEDLADVMKPTGNGFAEVFRRTADILSQTANNVDRQDVIDRFDRVGRFVGEAIIAWDCAVDFEADRIRGHFNPLKNEHDRQCAFQLCRLRLAQIGWHCPADSVSGQIIRSVMNRVEHHIMAPPAICSPTLMERWGLIRQKGYAYARCDGCEALCCLGEVMECCGSGIVMSGPGAPCCAEAACCITGEPCSTEKSNKQSTTRSSSTNNRNSPPAKKPELLDYTQFVGQVGQTFGALTPVGFVLIEGHQLPARNQSGEYVQPDVSVRVVAADKYGVTVCRE